MRSEPKVKMYRLLEYTGTRTDLDRLMRQNAIQGFRDFGHVQIREAILPFPDEFIERDDMQLPLTGIPVSQTTGD